MVCVWCVVKEGPMQHSLRVERGGVTGICAFISRRPPLEQARGGAGSGWRQGRVRWGRPLLSRPRGAVGSGPAAVESAAVSAVALTCGCVLVSLDGCEVRRCDPCALVRPRVPCVSRVCPVCVPAPPVVFLGYMLPGVFLPVHFLPVHEVLVSVSCVSRLPPVSFYRYMYVHCGGHLSLHSVLSPTR